MYVSNWELVKHLLVEGKIAKGTGPVSFVIGNKIKILTQKGNTSWVWHTEWSNHWSRHALLFVYVSEVMASHHKILPKKAWEISEPCILVHWESNLMCSIRFGCMLLLVVCDTIAHLWNEIKCHKHCHSYQESSTEQHLSQVDIWLNSKRHHNQYHKYYTWDIDGGSWAP